MFIPLHDANALEHIKRQYVTLALIAANILVFFVFESGAIGDGNFADVVSYSLIPTTFNDLEVRPPEFYSVPEVLTLFTYAFLHGDFWHLAGNMLFLWVFGDNVEDAMGHVRFLVFYLLCAAGGGLAHALVLPESDVPLVGASGAISGIVAAYLMLHPRVKIWILALGRIPLRLSAMWVLGVWIGFQFLSVAVATSDDEIAWWGHIGGLVTGAVLILVLRRDGVVLFDRNIAPAEPGET